MKLYIQRGLCVYVCMCAVCVSWEGIYHNVNRVNLWVVGLPLLSVFLILTHISQIFFIKQYQIIGNPGELP